MFIGPGAGHGYHLRGDLKLNDTEQGSSLTYSRLPFSLTLTEHSFYRAEPKHLSETGQQIFPTALPHYTRSPLTTTCHIPNTGRRYGTVRVT